MNEQTVNLDVSKETVLPQGVRIGQGDKGGTTIVANVYDDRQPATLTGMTARFCMRLPDNRHYVIDEDCIVSGSTITYVVDEEHCASVAGTTNEAYFEILDGDTVVYSTGRFSVQVLRAVNGSGTSADTWDNAFNEWMAQNSGFVSAAVGAANSAASTAGSAGANAAAKAVLANDAAARAELAIGAVGDMSEVVVPLMSSDTRGGAKVGSGLVVDADGKLNLSVPTITVARVHEITGTSS